MIGEIEEDDGWQERRQLGSLVSSASCTSYRFSMDHLSDFRR